jgi:hypothetical protein
VFATFNSIWRLEAPERHDRLSHEYQMGDAAR